MDIDVLDDIVASVAARGARRLRVAAPLPVSVRPDEASWHEIHAEVLSPSGESSPSGER